MRGELAAEQEKRQRVDRSFSGHGMEEMNKQSEGATGQEGVTAQVRPQGGRGLEARVR